MAKASGWLKISRKLANDDEWLAEPFTRGQAWVDLLMLATWETHESETAKGKKTYQAGTVYTSTRWLANRWKWTQSKVWRYLHALEKADKIAFLAESPFESPNESRSESRICLKNWAKYQLRESPSESPTESRSESNHKKEYTKEGKTEAAATSASERRVPPGYENDFATWEEYDAWRNQ